MAYRSALSYCLLALFLSGCAYKGGMTEAERSAAVTQAMTLADPAFEMIANAAPPLPSAAEAMLQPRPLAGTTESPVTEPRFDIKADAVSVPNFYHGLVEDSPYNVVVHPEVTGQISLQLSDVSVPEVMEILREGYGYHYQRTQGSFLIKPSVLETRMFSLNYINVQREGTSGTSISSGEIESSDEQDSDNNNSNANNDDASGSNLTTRSSSRLWRDVESAIEEIIAGQGDSEQSQSSGGDSARVVTSPESGSVIVRATPETLDQVETFIEGLQTTTNRQVILEARIVEVNLNDEFEAGIDWSYLGSTSGSDTSVGSSTGRQASLSLPSGFDGAIERNSGVFNLGVFREGSFSAAISALNTQGDVMVLSSPRVSTLNNQKALIKVGTDTFFQTGVELDTTITDGNAQTTVNPEFASFFSGISLDVTPSIDSESYVTLHIQPSVSDVSEVSRTVQTSSDSEDQVQFQLASSDVRRSDSIVRAQSGDLIVIGGLMEQREQTVDSSVPGLGQVPPFDLLFGRERQVSEKVELVILLRPTVVDEDTWDQTLDRQLEQML